MFQKMSLSKSSSPSASRLLESLLRVLLKIFHVHIRVSTSFSFVGKIDTQRCSHFDVLSSSMCLGVGVRVHVIIECCANTTLEHYVRLGFLGVSREKLAEKERRQNNHSTSLEERTSENKTPKNNHTENKKNPFRNIQF